VLFGLEVPTIAAVNGPAVGYGMNEAMAMARRILGEYQHALGDVLWETADHMEGVRSFVDRLDPEFRGR